MGAEWFKLNSVLVKTRAEAFCRTPAGHVMPVHGKSHPCLNVVLLDSCRAAENQ
jgi:hypothetical protein